MPAQASHAGGGGQGGKRKPSAVRERGSMARDTHLSLRFIISRTQKMMYIYIPVSGGRPRPRPEPIVTHRRQPGVAKDFRQDCPHRRGVN